VSNGPYAKKRPAITEQSLIRLNTWFQKESEWDETKILERGKSLFELATEIWPRPEAAELESSGQGE
jgi:hypothetical protein